MAALRTVPSTTPTFGAIAPVLANFVKAKERTKFEEMVRFGRRPILLYPFLAIRLLVRRSFAFKSNLHDAEHVKQEVSELFNVNGAHNLEFL